MYLFLLSLDEHHRFRVDSAIGILHGHREETRVAVAVADPVSHSLQGNHAQHAAGLPNLDKGSADDPSDYA